MKPRDLIPPVLVNVLEGVLGRGRPRLFASFAEALSVCSRNGYENDDLVEVVVKKTIAYRDRLFSKNAPCHLGPSAAFGICSLLPAHEGGTIRVLDFGGAAGAHYFLARSLLPSSVRLQWTVVETSAMAYRAKASLTGGELGFSDDPETAADELKQVDLLYASGALQCVDDPYTCLSRLLALSPRRLFLGRLGLTKGNRELIAVHRSRLSSNGPGPMPPGIVDRTVSYPFVFPREEVLMSLLDEDYEILATLDDPSGVFPIKGEKVVGLGLLARHRSEG